MNMNMRRVTSPCLGLLMVLFVLPAAGIFSQDGTLPELLHRPQRGEDPRYPEDMVIGPLDRGSVSEDVWRFARETLSALIAGNRSALTSVNGLDTILETLGEINPGAYRLGSGREQEDGSVSFLVRFIGREQWIAGELYVRPGEASDVSAVAEPEIAASPEAPVEEAPAVLADASANTGVPAWVFDDLLLEEKRGRGTEKDIRSFDFSSYERFF
jgi:hypothetical protein